MGIHVHIVFRFLNWYFQTWHSNPYCKNPYYLPISPNMFPNISPVWRQIYIIYVSLGKQIWKSRQQSETWKRKSWNIITLKVFFLRIKQTQIFNSCYTFLKRYNVINVSKDTAGLILSFLFQVNYQFVVIELLWKIVDVLIKIILDIWEIYLAEVNKIVSSAYTCNNIWVMRRE